MLPMLLTGRLYIDFSISGNIICIMYATMTLAFFSNCKKVMFVNSKENKADEGKRCGILLIRVVLIFSLYNTGCIAGLPYNLVFIYFLSKEEYAISSNGIEARILYIHAIICIWECARCLTQNLNISVERH